MLHESALAQTGNSHIKGGGFMSETLRKYGAKYNTTFCQFCGLSTDNKPIISFDGINIANGSEFVEIDTDTKYLYDAEHQQWIEG